MHLTLDEVQMSSRTEREPACHCESEMMCNHNRDTSARVFVSSPHLLFCDKYYFQKQHSVPVSAHFKVLLLTLKLLSGSTTLNESRHSHNSFTCSSVSVKRENPSGSLLLL